MPDCRPLGSHSNVALIPARAGSKRCPGKNTRLLDGKPLFEWSIDLAQSCGLFTSIVVSTDDNATESLAFMRGCETHHRKPEHATDDAPDYLWVADVLKDRTEDLFTILRPTSPFRSVSMLRRAYALLIGSRAHSVRAVQVVTEHPGKMWAPSGRYIRPVINKRRADGTPFHSSPTQSLPIYYRQTASLEMGWVGMVKQTRSIAGELVAPFLVDGLEAVDINTESDFAKAERLAALHGETHE